MLWLLAGLLLLLWVGGFILDVVGGFVHILLVLALIVLAFNLFRRFGRRAA